MSVGLYRKGSIGLELMGVYQAVAMHQLLYLIFGEDFRMNICVTETIILL